MTPEQEIKLSCLRLAQDGACSPADVVQRAKAYADFVEGKGSADHPVNPISLRDHFAAQALSGIMGNSGFKRMSYGLGHDEKNETVATVSYILADAMLAARTKDHGQ